MSGNRFHHLFRFIFCSAVALALSFASSPSSFASLGDTEDSVSADAAALSAQELEVKTTSNYVIHEMRSGSATIREYVNSSGVVVGIAWDGMRHPDLHALLGSRHNEYKAASKLQPREHGKRIRSVRSSNVVVETWGHMRKLQGHAYDPSLLSSGVDAREIQ